jgi:hypothetical protein
MYAAVLSGDCDRQTSRWGRFSEGEERAAERGAQTTNDQRLTTSYIRLFVRVVAGAHQRARFHVPEAELQSLFFQRDKLIG